MRFIKILGSYVAFLWSFVGQWKYGNWFRYPVAFFLVGWVALNLFWYVLRPPMQWITASYEKVLVLDKFIKENRYYASLKDIKTGKEFNVVIEDAPFWLRWDASDRYRDLKVGKEMMVKTAGIRLHIMSWFPNVIDVKKD